MLVQALTTALVGFVDANKVKHTRVITPCIFAVTTNAEYASNAVPTDNVCRVCIRAVIDARAYAMLLRFNSYARL